MHMHTESSAMPQGMPKPGLKGYERSDVAVKWVFGFIAALFLGGIALHFVIAWQLERLRKQSPPADQWARTGQVRSLDLVQQKVPRLQISPPAELQAFREREEAQLHSYGWINRTAGVARIPIERAMNLLVEKHLGVGTSNIQTGKSVLQLQQERVPYRARESREPQ
jgi:hypothetical protein